MRFLCRVLDSSGPDDYDRINGAANYHNIGASTERAGR
jgi:hypothetical protein